MLDLREIENWPVTSSLKGIPGDVTPFPLKELGGKGWNVLRGDLLTPLAVVKQPVLEENSRWMRRFVDQFGAGIAPHGKTTMCPQLFERQLADGAWGITLATMSQVHIARRFGVQRILLANQLTDLADLPWLAEELNINPQFDFYCLADSVAGVRLLNTALQEMKLQRPLNVLLEIGAAGARCGCRDAASALEVAREIASSPSLALCGVEGFEGSISRSTHEETADAIREYLQGMASIAKELARAKQFSARPILLSAGGSAWFDLVVETLGNVFPPADAEVVLRSGCYLTHDSKFYRLLHERLLKRCAAAENLGEGLQPSLEVWSRVQSRPETNRVVLTMGKRDVSFDIDLPVLQSWSRGELHAGPEPLSEGHKIIALNDQHAIVEIPADSPLAVGDLVSAGVSHPCTTFDRWQLLFLVDDDYNVTGGLKTFF